MSDAESESDHLLDFIKYKKGIINLPKKIVLQLIEQVSIWDYNDTYRRKFKKYDMRKYNPEAPEALETILDIMENKFNRGFSHVLIDYYPNGEYSARKHRDTFFNEPHKATYLISLGTARKFTFVRDSDKQEIECTLKHGDVMIYPHAINMNYKKKIPADAKKKTATIHIYAFPNGSKPDLGNDTVTPAYLQNMIKLSKK